MKMIVLVVLVAATACGSKKTADCDSAIAKGVEGFTTATKARAPNPQMVEQMAAALKEALTDRCKADQWPSEVVSCLATMTRIQDLQTCKSKLPGEQQTKLDNELREAMMSRRGMMGPRMPPVAGHPPMLAGSNAGAAAPGAPATAAPATGSATPPSGSPASGAAPGAATPAPAAPATSPASPAPGSSTPVTGSGGK